MISVELNQVLLRGGQKYPLKHLTRVLKVVEMATGKHKYDVSIAFVNPSAIRAANRTYRQRDEVTDVLSFQLSPQNGEILICYQKAKNQAKSNKHSVRAEVTFLIIHGLLHLFGYNHEQLSQQKKMFSLQSRILNKL